MMLVFAVSILLGVGTGFATGLFGLIAASAAMAVGLTAFAPTLPAAFIALACFEVAALAAMALRTGLFASAGTPVHRPRPMGTTVARTR